MKRFLIFLVAFLIMQTYASLADSANDTVWTRLSHSVINMEFAPDKDYLLSLGEHNDQYGVIIFNTDGDTVKTIYNSEGLQFSEHGGQGIRDAHFSKDGKYLVVVWEYLKGVTSRGMLEIFETENWTSVKKIELPGDTFSLFGAWVLISPDNSVIVGKTMDGFYFYDVQSGELLKHIWDYGQDMTKNNSPYKAFYSSDGQYIYFNASDNILRFLNTQTYQIDYSRQDQFDNVQSGSMAVSKSGNLLVNDAGNEELRIINTQTKETILSIPVYTGGIYGMDFSPDERYLAVNFGNGKVIHVYDIQAGKSIYQYTTVPAGYGLVGLAISPDQKFIVSSSGYLFLYRFLPTTGVIDNPFREEIIYPNPATNLVNILFNLKVPGYTKISIFDNTGLEVKKVFQGFLNIGEQNISSDVSKLKSGNYIIKVSNINTDISFKLIITK